MTEALKHIAPDVELHAAQNAGIEMALKYRKVLLSHDTGMGKSYMCAVVIRALINAEPQSKHIVVMVHDSIEQLPKDIAKIARVPVAAVDATAASAKAFASLLTNNSVICMTYDAFMEIGMALTLFSCIHKITSIAIDEAHHVANWNTSDRAFMVRAMAQYCPFILGLTATPMVVSALQFYRTMNLIDRTLSFRRDETKYGKYSERYLPVNREEYGLKGKYKPTLITVDPQLNQIGKQSGVVFSKLKGYGAEHQVSALIEVLRARIREEKQIIVYIAHHEVREWVEQHLEQEGIASVSINGRVVNQNERAARMAKFTTGEVPVLLTSITESLNLSADVIVFYEFDARMKQVMGRGHRGLHGKELEIVLIVTKDTDEISFFQEKVVERAQKAQTLLHKDYSEILALGDQIKKLDI